MIKIKKFEKNITKFLFLSFISLVVFFGSVGFAKAEVVDEYEGKLVSREGLGGHVFLIENGEKRFIPFNSSDEDNKYRETVIKSNNFDLDNVKVLSKEKLEAYSDAKNLGIKRQSQYLLRRVNNPTTFIVIEDLKLQKVNKNDYISYKEIIVPDIFFIDYEIIPNIINDVYSNSLINTYGFDDYLYYINEEEIKKSVPFIIDDKDNQYRNAIIDSYALNIEDVKTVSSAQLKSYPHGGNMTIKAESKYLLKMQNDNRYYIVTHDNFIKRVNKDDYSLYKEVIVPDSLFVNYIVKNKIMHYSNSALKIKFLFENFR